MSKPKSLFAVGLDADGEKKALPYVVGTPGLIWDGKWTVRVDNEKTAMAVAQMCNEAVRLGEKRGEENARAEIRKLLGVPSFAQMNSAVGPRRF